MRAAEPEYRQPPPEAPTWAREAWRLIVRHGLSQSRAAESVGRSRRQIGYWLRPGVRDRDRSRRAAARRRDPEGERAYQERYRAAHANRIRELHRERARRPENRGRCRACGRPMGIGVTDDGTCTWCIGKRRRERAELIASLHRRDVPLRDMATRLGWTVSRLSREIAELRRQGVYIPRRRGRRLSGG